MPAFLGGRRQSDSSQTKDPRLGFARQVTYASKTEGQARRDSRVASARFQNFPSHPVTNKEKRGRERERERECTNRKYIISQSTRLRHLAAGYRIKSNPTLQFTGHSFAPKIHDNPVQKQLSLHGSQGSRTDHSM
jgi:hypothetical protein